MKASAEGRAIFACSLDDAASWYEHVGHAMPWRRWLILAWRWRVFASDLIREKCVRLCFVEPDAFLFAACAAATNAMSVEGRVVHGSAFSLEGTNFRTPRFHNAAQQVVLLLSLQIARWVGVGIKEELFHSGGGGANHKSKQWEQQN